MYFVDESQKKRTNAICLYSSHYTWYASNLPFRFFQFFFLLACFYLTTFSHKIMTERNDTTKKMSQSLRSGHHATVYEVRRDPDLKNRNVIRDKSKVVFPFVSGSQYKGQWDGDEKDGFGIQINPDNTKYEGEWRMGKYHGRGTLWLKKGKTFNRQYVGDWSNGFMDGQGIFYCENSEIYRGGWLRNRKNGSGRYDYANGDSYFGEWINDLQDGFGTMNYANGNIFEGLWVKGNKEGPGLYYYASTKKVH